MHAVAAAVVSSRHPPHYHHHHRREWWHAGAPSSWRSRHRQGPLPSCAARVGGATTTTAKAQQKARCNRSAAADDDDEDAISAVFRGEQVVAKVGSMKQPRISLSSNVSSKGGAAAATAVGAESRPPKQQQQLRSSNSSSSPMSETTDGRGRRGDRQEDFLGSAVSAVPVEGAGKVEKRKKESLYPVVLLIQMEMCSGVTLRDWLDRKDRSTSPMSFTRSNKNCWQALELELFKQLMKGIRDIHERGIVHRDLKPENIFVDPHTHVLKIVDFGLAKFIQRESGSSNSRGSSVASSSDLLLSSSQVNKMNNAAAAAAGPEDFAGIAKGPQQQKQRFHGVHDKAKQMGRNMEMSYKGEVIGTPAYAAPEGGGLCDEKADIYSGALILLELLCPRFTTVMERVKTLEEFKCYYKVPEHVKKNLHPWLLLMMAMARPNPQHRPSAPVILKQVKALLASPTLGCSPLEMSADSSLLPPSLSSASAPAAATALTHAAALTAGTAAALTTNPTAAFTTGTVAALPAVTAAALPAVTAAALPAVTAAALPAVTAATLPAVNAAALPAVTAAALPAVNAAALPAVNAAALPAVNAAALPAVNAAALPAVTAAGLPAATAAALPAVTAAGLPVVTAAGLTTNPAVALSTHTNEATLTANTAAVLPDAAALGRVLSGDTTEGVRAPVAATSATGPVPLANITENNNLAETSLTGAAPATLVFSDPLTAAALPAAAKLSAVSADVEIPSMIPASDSVVFDKDAAAASSSAEKNAGVDAFKRN